MEAGVKVKAVLLDPINLPQPEELEKKKKRERKKKGGREKKKRSIWFTIPEGKVSCLAVEKLRADGMARSEVGSFSLPSLQF